jgi:ubiquinone/menaquinone biosynthesis C-methylase UbiE
MSDLNQVFVAERERILGEYARREKEVPSQQYAPWDPATQLMLAERKRLAARMLHRAGVFPGPGDRCLEVGCGALGWIGDLVSWRVGERQIHGIDLDASRVAALRDTLPNAAIEAGDATELPWPTNHFRLVIASTVFTSILAPPMRQRVAQEITRVLLPGGALLWYDFAWNNPRNANVRAVTRKELAQLFPDLRGEIRRVTLAPPLARAVAPRSWALATLMAAIPGLRSHLLAVLVKP